MLQLTGCKVSPQTRPLPSFVEVGVAKRDMSLPDITWSSVHSATANRSAQWHALPAPPPERSAQWHALPAPPPERSAALSFCGSVLALVGLHGNKISTVIHAYQPATNNWIKVGDLPCPQYACSSTLLPSGKILIAGGVDSNWN